MISSDCTFGAAPRRPTSPSRTSCAPCGFRTTTSSSVVPRISSSTESVGMGATSKREVLSAGPAGEELQAGLGAGLGVVAQGGGRPEVGRGVGQAADVQGAVGLADHRREGVGGGAGHAAGVRDGGLGLATGEEEQQREDAGQGHGLRVSLGAR